MLTVATRWRLRFAAPPREQLRIDFQVISDQGCFRTVAATACANAKRRTRSVPFGNPRTTEPSRLAGAFSWSPWLGRCERPSNGSAGGVFIVPVKVQTLSSEMRSESGTRSIGRSCESSRPILTDSRYGGISSIGIPKSSGFRQAVQSCRPVESAHGTLLVR
jgi:hypothetical protein